METSRIRFNETTMHFRLGAGRDYEAYELKHNAGILIFDEQCHYLAGALARRWGLFLLPICIQRDRHLTTEEEMEAVRNGGYVLMSPKSPKSGDIRSMG